MAAVAADEAVELKFRLDDGTDIGPLKFNPAATVLALKEAIVSQWPSGKSISPKSTVDVKLINGGKILENSKTLSESRVPIAEIPGSAITMHVVIRPPNSNKSNNFQSNDPAQGGCGCSIL